MTAAPERIELTQAEKAELISRIKSNSLTEDDSDMLIGLIEFNHWLQIQIIEKNISIHKLRHAFFGPSEKKASNTPEKPKVPKDLAKPIEPARKLAISKNHGRLSADDYTEIETVNVEHTEYKAGQECPELCGGRLWPVSPGNIVKITGQGFAKATKYVQKKLRCGLCGMLFTAPLPSDISNDKYDYNMKSQLCMLKYYMGLPFYRLETYQSVLGMPLPDSTQWKLVEEVADSIYPIFYSLEKLAAQGRLAHADDTSVKIISCILENKKMTDRKQRKGMFTTGVLSYVGQHKIYLFYSGRKHAGENIKHILLNRSPSMEPILYMCDALSRNIPKELKTILIHCISHARRKFVEVEPYFDKECGYVIDQLAKIYGFDAKAKEQGMSLDERLSYHQENSGPIMSKLHAWLKQQFDKGLVEPNSALGKAIGYFLKHWDALTQFLKIAGAPLDNNILEAALKLPIRVRKNAMFYATEHGAFVGNMLLSIIQTCIGANENPVEYLTALQQNKSQIFKEPEKLLPWNYKHQIDQVDAVAA